MFKASFKWVLGLSLMLVFSLGAGAGANDNFVLVDLLDYVNNDGISWIEFPGDQDLDGGGWGFPAEELPLGDFEIAWDEDTVVPFKALMMDDGWGNNIEAEWQDVEVPAGYYSGAWFLVVHHHGATEDGVIEFNYSDGSWSEALFSAGDWCGSPVGDEKVALKPAYRHNADGITTPSCAMWILPRMELDSSKELVSITLPNEDRLHVFGITLEK